MKVVTPPVVGGKGPTTSTRSLSAMGNLQGTLALCARLHHSSRGRALYHPSLSLREALLTVNTATVYGEHSSLAVYWVLHASAGPE